MIFKNYIKLPENKWEQLGIVLVVQLLLILVGFNKIAFSPEANVFFDLWDGAKNYYTYLWFVHQPESVPYLYFNGNNYPYGEYIYYVDNTPILAVAVRWVHLNLVDLSGHFTAIFNWVMLLNILISTAVLFFILRRLGLSKLWVVVCALCLVWLHPQIMRLGVGHFNLSFSWTLLLVFYAQLVLFGHLMAGSLKQVLCASWALALATIIASFCHFYYLPLMLLWLGCFLGVICLYQVWKKQVPWIPALSGILVAGISVAGSFGMIQLTDHYLNDRLVTGGGYGYKPWVLTFTDMFTAYRFDTLQFIFQFKFSGHYESFSYWGSGALYGLLMILIWWVWRYYIKRQKPNLNIANGWGLFWVSVGFGAVVMMLIALSESVEIIPGHHWRNHLNLFSFFKLFTPRVTQFRALGRFVWPLVWFVNLFLLWYLAYRKASLPRAFGAIVMFLLLVDTFDMVRHHNKTFYANPFAETVLEQIRQQVPIENPQRYQAILPIPFYHVGSDNYDITIDPETYWGREAPQISLAYKLPLMSCQLARTATYQAMNLLGLFQGRGINEDMIALMDNRPVLVLVKRTLLDPCSEGKEIPADWALDICQMPIVWQNSAFALYEWQPK